MRAELLKISEFAALAGISRKLLIFYDKCGLLKPQFVNPGNGYRYYSYRQIDTAGVIVALRQAGMPLADIEKYLKHKSPGALMDMLREREDALERQISGLMKIKGMIRTRVEQTQKGVAVKVQPAHAELQPAENLFLGPKLPQNYDLADGWAYLPHFYAACKEQGIQLGFAVGTMVSQPKLERHLWCKPSHYFYRLPHGQYPPYHTKPQGQYVVGSEYADYGEVEPLYNKLLAFIAKEQLKIQGNAYEEYLIDEFAQENPTRYLLQIAIGVDRC